MAFKERGIFTAILVKINEFFGFWGGHKFLWTVMGIKAIRLEFRRGGGKAVLSGDVH
ncbi:hypothetical protein [Bartonella henselae]|uniref:Uncharacterized protein n=1 Tax=Bartonella henselae TaxID=38323 RepID=X5LY99_BARHN|nr:hypothetical protein [Bartonella henselae]MDM9996468.1 hypothetical protein [Bartonella henselae]UJM42805.1 hypothetical protein KAE73_05655 [Bartonella henselae]CDO46172.1 hypothetical protein BM1374165_00146 [Bartonella henselae]